VRPHDDVAANDRVHQVLGLVQLGVVDARPRQIDRAARRAEARAHRLGARLVCERPRERVLSGVLRHVIETPLAIDDSGDRGVRVEPDLDRSVEHMMNHARVVDLRIDDLRDDVADGERADVAELTTALRVEQRLRDHERGLPMEIGHARAARLERREVRILPVEFLGHRVLPNSAGA
jgi:hypothetical protein